MWSPVTGPSRSPSETAKYVAVKNASMSQMHPINTFPDELLARVFVVGSWLPGRTLDMLGIEKSSSPHGPRLKHFAYQASRVCRHWHSIIHWRSLKKDVYYSKICLDIKDLSSFDQDPLNGYFRALQAAEDVDIDMYWALRHEDDDLHSERPLTDPIIQAFLHGFKLTKPHLNRIRRWEIDSQHPEVIEFSVNVISSLEPGSQLTHLRIRGMADEFGSWAPNLVPIETTLSYSGMEPPAERPADNKAHTPPASLSELEFSSQSMLDISSLFTNLSYLSLDVINLSWNQLCYLFRNCENLIDLHLDVADIEAAPDVIPDSAVVMPNLTQLGLTGIQVHSVRNILAQFRMPLLEGLDISERAEYNSVILMEEPLYFTPEAVRYIAPRDLGVFSCTEPRYLQQVLADMSLEEVQDLVLACGDSESTLAEVMDDRYPSCGPIPNLTSLALCSMGGADWIPMMRWLGITSTSKLELRDSSPDVSPYWLKFVSEMNALVSNLTELHMTANLTMPSMEGIESHPLGTAVLVNTFVLQDLDGSNFKSLEWLVIPSPEAGISSSQIPDPVCCKFMQATMPLLHTVRLQIRRDLSMAFFLDTLAPVLHLAVDSRGASGNALSHIDLIDVFGEVIWRADDLVVQIANGVILEGWRGLSL